MQSAGVRLRVASAIAWLAMLGSACHLMGSDTGECMDVAEYGSFISFCGDLPLFMEHTIRTKDEWVRESYTRIVRERIRIETNETLQDLDVDERGMGSAPQRRFYDNPDCHQAYKNFFCWMNFPRCNEEDKSLIMCRSVCENFFKACKVPTDLHRCGPSKWHNGNEPEGDEVLDRDGFPVYLRWFYPGQPFRDNAFDRSDDPIVVCTPSIKNAAAPAATPRVLGVMGALLLALAVALRVQAV